MDIRRFIIAAALDRIKNRAADLTDAHDMLDGQYRPPAGFITPPFREGSSRERAWKRALETTSTSVPFIVDRRLAALDFANVTWDEATSREADDLMRDLDLEGMARELATEYTVGGAAVGMASEPRLADGEDGTERVGTPTIGMLSGVHMPYSVPHDPGTISGWYRALQYADPESGHALRWWVEVYDWQDARTEDDPIIHRIWRRLQRPTDLGQAPDDEYLSTARPRFALAGVTDDGLPRSPILSGMGRILGLYATELRLAAAEEMAGFPMLMLIGDPDMDQAGVAEVIVGDTESDAKWLDPGNLEELRQQLSLKREQVRETFNLPGGALGSQTPSGEALQEANRGHMQEAQRTADAVGHVLTHVCRDYLALHDLPDAIGRVSIPIDRAYLQATLLETVEKGVDLGAVPATVTARIFQQFLGSAAYSDEDLEAHVKAKQQQMVGTPIGGLFAADDDGADDDEG